MNMRSRVAETVGRCVTNRHHSVRPVAALRSMRVSDETSPSLCGLRQQFRQPDQIERGAGKYHEPVDLRQAAEFDLAHPADRFQPAERRFDPGPSVLTRGVARVPRRASIDRAPAPSRQILGDMWRAPELTRDIDKL